MPEPCISVVMPTYNRATYIGRALDSVAAQSEPALEVVVVDDQSTDDTRERVLAHPSASRILYVSQPERRGASHARNVGVDRASGRIIVFLDSDDLLEVQHHAAVLQTLADPSIALFCCDSQMIDASEAISGAGTWTSVQCAIKGVRVATGRRSGAEVLLFSTPFPGMAVRRDVYLAVGGFDQDLFPLDDFDFQLRVAARGFGVFYRHEPLARYRVHGTNESGPAQAVRVCEKKLRCLRISRERDPETRRMGRAFVRRMAEVRRELGLAELKRGHWGAGLRAISRSLAEDPSGWKELAGILSRKLRPPDDTRRSRIRR